MDINYYEQLQQSKKLVFMGIAYVLGEIKIYKNFGTELLS